MLAELVVTFFADADQLQVSGAILFGILLLNQMIGGLDNIRVKRPAKSFVRSDYNDNHLFGFALFEERQLLGARVGTGQIIQNLVQLLGVGAEILNGGLGTTKLCGRHQLHGAGNLLRRFDRGDSGTYFL